MTLFRMPLWGFLQFGTPLGNALTELLTRLTMLNQVNQYLKLKRQAMHLMLTGDLKRYMDTLRQLHELRKRGLAA